MPWRCGLLTYFMVFCQQKKAVIEVMLYLLSSPTLQILSAASRIDAKVLLREEILLFLIKQRTVWILKC